MRGFGLFTAVSLITITTSSVAAGQTLSLEAAMAGARSRAPEVLAAMARVEEARARLLGASIRFRDNPVVDADTGPRTGGERRTWDFAAGIGQTFETGGQRAARMSSAQADIARATADADERARIVTRNVALAFVTASAADERVKLLVAAEALAQQLRDAMARRYEAGDIAALDLNLTSIAAARARADRIRAEADRRDALRPLLTALGLTGDSRLELTSALDRQPAPRATLLAAIADAPVLRGAAAEIEQARAEVRLGRALASPDIGARVAVRREQDDRIVTAGVSIVLPTFNRGQAIAGEAAARLKRLERERDAARTAIEVEAVAGLTAYAQRREAADLLRDVALPAADDNESLAARSLDAGEIGLMDFLLVRQDVARARLEYLDALTAAALAAVEIDASVGALR